MLNIIQKLVDLHSLTEAEAETAMNSIMDGKTTDAQIGSFLTALRIKGETPDEIAGFVKVMINKARKIHPKGKTLLDTCGTGGDNSNTFNISTAVAFVVAGAGIPVVKHGNRSVSSKCGSADVLQALGVNLAITLENVEDCINKIGIGFLFAPLFHQAMKNVANPRKEIGIRTVFNVLGPLANPARATHQILGVYNEQLTETMAEVLKKRGIKRALVVHGSGLDEITICGKTKITELDKGQIKSYYVFPKDFGIAEANLKEIKGGNPEENAKIILDILNGKEGPKRDIVILNSAAALYMSGKSNSIKEGIAIAKDSIDSGKAMSKLRLLVEQSNSYRGGNGKNNILNKIVGHKKQEIESKKKKLPLDRLRNKISSEESQARDFKKALKKKGEVAIIAEIKKSSPSTGIIRENFDHISIAKDYDKAKVDAISVLTDKRFFGGKLDFIKDIKKVTNVPILRKDFIVDNYQIYESKLYDADAILLIAGILSLKELKGFLHIAKELDIQCLVECHNKHEINDAISAGAEIIGINNRDLTTFSVDLDRFSELRKLIPANIAVVSESGMNTFHDASKMKAYGADAILIGTSLMKSDNIPEKIKELRGLRK